MGFDVRVVRPGKAVGWSGCTGRGGWDKLAWDEIADCGKPVPPLAGPAAIPFAKVLLLLRLPLKEPEGDKEGGGPDLTKALLWSDQGEKRGISSESWVKLLKTENIYPVGFAKESFGKSIWHSQKEHEPAKTNTSGQYIPSLTP
jgi:hypothetical protein